MGGKSSTQSMLNAVVGPLNGRRELARGEGSPMTITIPNEVLTVLVGFALVAGLALVTTFLLE